MEISNPMASIVEAQNRAGLLRRGVLLEYLTIGYNFIEAAVAIAAGIAAGSLALIAFGLDSVIEIVAGAAVLWRLKRELADGGGRGHMYLERRALKVVGLTFFALAAYILIEAAGPRQAPPVSSWPQSLWR
jgi:divalent metal cation (Fe/Co/Zn/Cd) transporter